MLKKNSLLALSQGGLIIVRCIRDLIAGKALCDPIVMKFSVPVHTTLTTQGLEKSSPVLAPPVKYARLLSFPVASS